MTDTTHGADIGQDHGEKCVLCNGRGYLRCGCWPGDCICGYGDEICWNCDGDGRIWPDDYSDEGGGE